MKLYKSLLYLSIFVLIIPAYIKADDHADLSTTTHKLVIIGSGIAGLTAALYGAREKLDPIVIEGDECGGMLVNAGPVENYPGQLSTIGPDLVGTAKTQAETYGAQFLSESAVKVDFTQRPLRIWTTSGLELKTHSVIIATGSLPRRLNCPGEMEFWGKGVAICVLCDGPLFANKTIVVTGGGDLALDKALFLARYASKVIIVHRKPLLTASPYMQDKIMQNPKISTIGNARVVEIKGTETTVTGVILEDSTTKNRSELKTDGVFLAIGFNPCSSIFQGQIELTPDGYITLKNGFTKTSVEGVFAAGNVASHGYTPAIIAAGTGCMAGVDAETYLTDMFPKTKKLKHTLCHHRTHAMTEDEQ